MLRMGVFKGLDVISKPLACRDLRRRLLNAKLQPILGRHHPTTSVHAIPELKTLYFVWMISAALAPDTTPSCAPTFNSRIGSFGTLLSRVS